MGILRKLKSDSSVRFEKSNVGKAARYVRDKSLPVYKKANQFVSGLARKEDKVVKYATAPPKKIKHSRVLPWRL